MKQRRNKLTHKKGHYFGTFGAVINMDGTAGVSAVEATRNKQYECELLRKVFQRIKKAE